MSTQSIQQTIFTKIKEALPDAEVKKIDKDNFLDILPFITSNRKDVLFFNTKNESAIKLGFTCSDRVLIDSIITTNTNQYTAFSGGLKCSKDCNLYEAIIVALDIISKCTIQSSNLVETNTVTLQEETKVIEEKHLEQSTKIEKQVIVQELPKEKNPDPSYLASLFQKNDFEGVCYHADLSKEYSNNTFDKIIVSAIETQNEMIIQICKKRYDNLYERSFLKKQGDFEKYKSKWKELFEKSKDQLKHETEFTGEVNSENKPNGKGVLKYLITNGVYEGMFKDGNRHGLGIHKWGNGDLYEGEWKDNMRHGNGMLKYANKNFYTGQWYQNMKSGNGKMIFANGEEYEGNWQTDKINGSGKYKFIDDCIFEGYFREGKIMDFGKFIFTNGVTLEGYFDVKRTGKGKKIMPNGDVYEGEIYEGKMEGNGKMNFTDGDFYEGTWRNDKPTGKTVFELKREKERIEKELEFQRILKLEEARVQRELKAFDKYREEKIKERVVSNDKSKDTKFAITYKVKLKEAKLEAVVKGSVLGTLLGHDKMRFGVKTTNDRGEKIERKIIVKHNGTSMTSSVAKSFVENEDRDVKSGKAGTSTIEIVSINSI